MRIVQLATSLHGGAGVAALRMNNALNLIGEDSTIICREEAITSGKKNYNSKKINLAKKVKSSGVTLFQSKIIQKNDDLVTPWSISTLDFQNTFIEKADIIHIHAYYNFLSIASLRRIVLLGKPTLFTLHDQRLFTGGCHYSRECTNFQHNCSPCPQVRGPFNSIVKNALSKQKTIFDSSTNIELVTPSYWLKDLVNSSSISMDLTVHVVRNPIPKIFFETPILPDINSENVIRIAFIATNLHNPYKDLKVFTTAINKYSQSTKKKICVVLVGYGDIPRFESNVKVENYQPNSNLEMATLLSAIDLLIVPSNQDNSPSVIGEALAAGVTVIGSNVGGIPEILSDFEMPTFPVGDSSKLESIIRNWRPPASREKIREKALKYFGEDKSALELLKIYRNLQKKLSKGF